MADKNSKYIENVTGRYYVDNSCVDCDQCRNIAPKTFRRAGDGASSYVHRQPLTSEEIVAAEEARTSCPTESIGNDGD